MAGDLGARGLVAAAVGAVEVLAAAVEQSDGKGTIMKKALTLAALGLAVSLVGCTGTRLAKLPLCDGHHMFGDGVLLGEAVAAWLAGDHIKAVHILVPQVEAAFRKMAGRLGRPTTEPHPQMKRARNAKSFGKMLGDMETVAVLGKHGPDLILHLRTLYTDPRGHNLRNDLAHGLLPSSNITATTSLLVVHSLLLLGLAVFHRQLPCAIDV